MITFATDLTQNDTMKGIHLYRPILCGEQEDSTDYVGCILKENHWLIELHMSKHAIKKIAIK